MYISLEWLKDFVEIPKNITPDDLGRKLTMHTVEIDNVLLESDKFKHVVVGEIKAVRPHPNADRLRIAMVDAGGDKDLNIVCGAPNIEAGQKVPVALIGAILPGDIEIKAVKVRGEDSEGMLCAQDELGLGDDHEGIFILDKKAKIGQNFGLYLKLKDVIYEVDNKSITNRPDLWCHQGMARDISVFLDSKFKGYKPKISLAAEAGKNEEVLEVTVDDQAKCPRYMAVKMDKIEVKKSPEWLEKRLIAVGVRPINNIVDITNYVMMELGQPLHAFDSSSIALDKNGRHKIIVRNAMSGEKFTTLDQEQRTLDKDDLLITDQEKAIAVAGVMGGENSGINNETVSIIIESANFDFVSVRRTSQRLGLRTDASKRFEKSLDPNICELALSRAVELIKELSPQAHITSQVADVKKFSLPTGPIELSFAWLDRVIGQKIDRKKSADILTRLGFSVEESKAGFSVTVPSWRATKDIATKEDLAEEIERIIGYDNLKPAMPQVAMKAPLENRERKLERQIKGLLSFGAKLSETHNYSFVGEEQLEKLGIDHSSHIRLIKPLARQHSLCRQSLVPNLLDNIRLNQARFDEFGLYEIGSIFSSLDGGQAMDLSPDKKLPYQEKRIGLALAGNNNHDAYDQMKGIVNYLFQNFNIEVSFETSETINNWADKDYACQIVAKGKSLGSVDILNGTAAKKAGLKKNVALAEISYPKIVDLCEESGDRKFVEFEKFPPLIRDLAFVVNKKVSYNNIKEAIFGFSEIIRSVELFDSFESEKLGRENKSLAFRVVYQAQKTLTGKEVDEMQEKLWKHLEDRFGAKIRNF